MIVVGERVSRATPRSGKPSVECVNTISWRQEPVSKVIFAVGGPRYGQRQETLPADVVTTDLTAASAEHPALARQLWGAFLLYLHYTADFGVRQRMRTLLFGIPVRVAIVDPGIRADVRAAIAGCESRRIVLQRD